MKNFKCLFEHELLYLIKSNKFIFMLLISVSISSFFCYLQVEDFKDRQSVYLMEKQKSEEFLKSAKVFSEVKTNVLVPPYTLSIFSKGVSETMGNKAVISISDLPLLQTTSERRNPFMFVFNYYDLSHIILIIMSLFSLFLIGDSISGEKEQDTLKLVFSNKIKKPIFFTVKYLACLLIITIPLTIIFGIILLYIFISPQISLSSEELMGVIILFLSSELYISIFILIGLIVSSINNTISQTTIVNLCIWCLLIFVYPNIVSHFISNTNKISSKEEIDHMILEIKSNFFKRSVEISDELYHNKDMSSWSSGGFNESYMGFLTKHIDVTQKYHFEFLEEYNKRMIPLLITEQDKIMSIIDDYNSQINQQNRKTSIYTSFLPNKIYVDCCSKLSLTNYNYYTEVRNKINNYRNLFLEFMKINDGFGIKFFTQMKKEDMREDYDDYIINNNSNLVYSNYSPISINDFPEIHLSYSLNFPLQVIALFFYNLILFFIGLQIFNKSKII